MALVLADRVQETTTTTGTGTVTLAGAVSGYQSFAAIGNGNTTYYTITSGTDWEVGIGTYTAAGTTLARTTILSSSAAGAAITLAGTSTVFATYPAERAVAFDSAGNSNLLGVNNIDYGYSTFATAAGTTTLTVASPYYIYFTGATTQTVVMPVTSTLALGWSYHIANNSTGNITVNSSGGNLIGTILPGTTFHITCIDTTVTTAAGWDYGYTDFGTATGTGSVVLSASPTFTGTVNAAGLTTTSTILAQGGVSVQAGTLGVSGSSAVSMIGTGAITIGATTATNAITLGQSTAAQTVNIATGATLTATTKAVNIGTAGVSGSTTNITLGSATSGATSTTTVNGTLTGTIKSYKEFVTAGSSSTAFAADLSTANIFNVSMTGNCTFTFTNPPASGTSFSFMLILTQDATGSRTATWPASVKWPNGSTPTLTTTANKVDILNFITVDGGTTYYGALSLANM